MECVLVKTSQIAMKPMIAQTISERSGRPGSPPPPPPKRARPRRNRSSSCEMLEPPLIVLRPRRGGSPQGPLPCPLPSSDGGSPPYSPPPLLGPQGPLVSVKKPRMRPPHPMNVLIADEYRDAPRRKTVASGPSAP